MTAFATYMMITLQRAMRAISEELAQDSFEYLLVIGGISVAVVVAMVTPIGHTLIDGVMNGTCTAMKTAVSTITCPLV